MVFNATFNNISVILWRETILKWTIITNNPAPKPLFIAKEIKLSYK